MTMPASTGELFVWTDFNGQQFPFFIPRLSAWCEGRLQPVMMNFQPAFREELKITNDVHEPRAMALPAAAFARPAICLFTPRGNGADVSGIIVDGAHRLWRLLGVSLQVPIYAVPWDQAVPRFLITPEEQAHIIHQQVPVDTDGNLYDATSHRQRALDILSEEELQRWKK